MIDKWQRAKAENEWKSRQRGYVKYERLTNYYAYPLHEWKYNKDGELK